MGVEERVMEVSMIVKTNITPDEIEYLLRMLMDIMRNQPNKAKILR